MKPPNKNTVNIDKLPAVEVETMVWPTEATKRNMDIDVKCTAKSRINWRKNLLSTGDERNYDRVSI